MTETLTDRSLFIGGSDAAAACGLDPYRTPVRLYLEKTGELPGPEESEAMTWGKRLEPVIIGWVRETGLDVLEGDGGFTHPDHPWMRGTVDGLILDANFETEGVLEVKTAGLRAADGWADDQIPIQYRVQGQHYLAVTGLSYVLFACLIGGQQFETRRMDRDDEVIGLIIEREQELWRRIQEKEPPAPGAQDLDLLKLLYPVARERSTASLDHISDVRHRYRTAREALKAAEEAVAAVESEVKAAIGDAEIGVVNGLPAFRWTNVTARKLDAKALAEELPDVHANYYRETVYRRFSEVKS